MNLASRLLLFFLVGSAPLFAAEPTRPNFLFILMDDMGWTDLGCYGSKFYRSPNVDALAAQGMKFTQAYAACPVCSPTRASILTGKYPARLHLTDFIPGRAVMDDQKLLRPDFRKQLPLEEITLAEALKPAGYVSGAFGKWHLGGKGFEPMEQGFDTTFAGNPQGGMPGSKEEGKGEFEITEAALKFLDANRARPFFAYVCYNTPHIPLAAPAEMVEKYEKRIDPTASHTNAVYASMIESADTQIGRLLAKLDELKLDQKTVVIFTSDNGGLHVREWKRSVKATQNLPLRAGKGYLYEGGVRVPLIVRWPGVVNPATVQTNVTTSVDYFPTLLQIAGVAISTNQPVDGQSLLPLLAQNSAMRPRAIFWHYPHYPNQGGAPGGAVREGDFKLIEFYEDGRWELYNLREDIGETKDLAEAQPAKAAQLAAKLDLWRRNVGAEMMLPNPNWNPAKPRYVPAE
ncbi:MAG: sulfatase [Verrucomicrobiota bacterium]